MSPQGADALASMSDDLQRRLKELERSNAELEHSNAELERLNVELERSNADLQRSNAGLRHANADFERSNADLSQIAHVAAHHLSEPLRTVASFAQLLQRRYQPQLDARADRYISHIVCGAERMRVLIDDLLDYSSILKEYPDQQTLDLAAIVAEAWTGLRPPADDSGAELTVGELPQVHADRRHARLILQHLLSNSLKFCERPKPAIRVEAARAHDEWLISVTDNGIGIHSRHAERVFLIFERLHSEDAYEGTGIGLAICKRLVERHGGSIWAEPAPGGGTRMCFTLPDRPANSY